MSDDRNDTDERECSSCGRTKLLREFTTGQTRCKECETLWSAFRQGIDERLDTTRPARAAAAEREWREEVYAWARNHMPNESNLVRTTAQREVDRRERDATHRGNGVLRGWMNGQIPLFWSDIGATPIKVGNDHVRLDAATVHDGRQFEREQRDGAKRDYDSRLVICDAARELADLATAKGYVRLSQLGDLPPHGLEDEAVA